MPDNLHPDQNELQQATSRTLPAGAALSADGAAERDGFLALGAALESAAGQLDEAALIAQLKKSALVFESGAVTIRAPRRSESSWQAALSIALAAAALVALARIAIQSPDVLRPKNALTAQHETAPGGEPNVAAEHMPASRSAWLDPLDDEIALARAEFQLLSDGQRGVDGSLLRMNEQLEALSHELFQGSL
jgi:hypothetical protein